jgi:predicted anti-sigma-YlaC factor YlaD
MDCERWQEAVSALIDGEDPVLDPRLVAAHLDRCASCREFRAVATEARRRSRVREAEPLADIAGKVTKLRRFIELNASWTIARVLLAAAAIEVIALSVPELLGSSSASSPHDARHLGAFSVAYGTALLVAVVRPARARAILPVALVLGGALVITATVDLFAGRIPLLGETQHLPEVASVVLLWMLARPTVRPRSVQPGLTRPQLRAVDDHRHTG